MTNLPPIVGIVGRSGAGKTTLIEKLIPALKARGYRVGTIKHHAHPGFEIDQPGKDTYRHAQAGADHVVISAPDKVAAIRRVDEELSVFEVAGTMEDVDIILTDGYKSAPIRKIEVVRQARSEELICSRDDLIAVASDFDPDVECPIFSLDDPEELADWIEMMFLFDA